MADSRILQLKILSGTRQQVINGVRLSCHIAEMQATLAHRTRPKTQYIFPLSLQLHALVYRLGRYQTRVHSII